jgi:hypothetical protein
MKYIVKNIKTGEYLRQGDTFFVWTPDIYYAKVFKGLNGAQNTLKKIVNSNIRYGESAGEYKIFGIEMKEVEVA